MNRTMIATVGLILRLGMSAPAALAATPPAPAPTPHAHGSWKDQMFFGGGVGLGFGTVDWVSVEPLLGIRIHPKVALGASVLYRWTDDGRYDPNVSTTDYGGRVFAQFYPVPSFFLMAEYEYLNYEYISSAFLDTARNSASSVLGGAGISQPIGRGAAFYASALYNFSYDSDDPTSPYDDPWVYGVGVMVGF
jgi:hypothetical protein